VDLYKQWIQLIIIQNNQEITEEFKIEQSSHLHLLKPPQNLFIYSIHIFFCHSYFSLTSL